MSVQLTLNQVVVQLSSAGTVGGNGPVFSVSSTPVEAGSASLVQVSAAARAMAEVSGTGARPQLALFVQQVGSLGGRAAHSFQPVSPATIAAERFAPPAADPGQQARTEAADEALARDQQQAAVAAPSTQAAEVAAPALPATDAAVAAAASASVAAYRGVGAVPTAATTPLVNVSA